MCQYQSSTGIHHALPLEVGFIIPMQMKYRLQKVKEINHSLRLKAVLLLSKVSVSVRCLTEGGRGSGGDPFLPCLEFSWLSLMVPFWVPMLPSIMAKGWG